MIHPTTASPAAGPASDRPAETGPATPPDNRPDPAPNARVLSLTGAATSPAPGPGETRQPTERPSAEAGPAAPPGTVIGPRPIHAPTAVPPLRKPAPAPVRDATASEAQPAAVGPARLRLRHHAIAASFVLAVVLPTFLAIVYAFTLARDQFASNMSFSVRTEEFQSSLDLLGGISKLSGSAGSDIGILSDFILSQQMVAKVAKTVDLRQAFSAGWPWDFIFAYNPSGAIEDLHAHWLRQVELTTDSGRLQLRVYSYDAELSRQINQAIYAESSVLVNMLSEEARRDATRYTRAELARAEERLSRAREAMTEFRMSTQIVDPASAAQSQLGVINTLNAQLAEELISRDLLGMQAQGNDPRISETERRIQAIRNRIEEEKSRFGPGGQGPGGEDYSTLFARYERLAAELQFAEEAYRVAQVAYDSAQADAQRKSRYIVAHVEPTLAESSTYPDRFQMSFLSFFFLLLFWSMGVLVYYSIRDRR